MEIKKTDIDRYQRAFGSIEGLAAVVRRLTQEVEVLKTMLRDRGIWDEPSYKNTIVDRFISDHSSASCCSELNYSYYPYLLEESTFLKFRFNATDSEIAAFERKVETVSTLT